MAYWIAINKGEVGYSSGDFRCTDCGKPCPCYHLTKFCPNCGALMQRTTGLTAIERELLLIEADENAEKDGSKQTDCQWR